ncbi:hypothetical protein MSG28_007504 [Choristoneura fumiferana]|uniref:Uncharacterized protein n=1 Tax=Choristoneura fumiferana TaxID=7141 RepID=A0ACC0JY33_CHOFU|nr:hypothetical protein MSG28_007504 [Choristoneura fumiferana]
MDNRSYKELTSERDNPTAFQDNRENVENERKSFPYILNPTKYENQQNWGLNDPTSFPNNQGNTAYNGYKTTITPLPNKYSQRQELDSDSPISFGDNGWSTDYNGYNNANTFNPTTNKEQQRSSFAPTTSHFNNKVTPGNNLNYAGSPVNINSRGSFYDGVENTKLLLPDNDKKRNPADEYLSDYADEFSTDYTTTTDNEWLGRSSVHVVRETYFFHSLYIRGSCKIVAHSNHNLTRKSPLDFVIHSSTNMFLSLIVAAVLVPIFTASPVIDSQAKPQVLRYDTSDGSSRTERGAILNLGTKDAALDVLGTVRWYDNKGQLYEMSYKAGKRGYRTIIKKVHEE